MSRLLVLFGSIAILFIAIMLGSCADMPTTPETPPPVSMQPRQGFWVCPTYTYGNECVGWDWEWCSDRSSSSGAFCNTTEDVCDEWTLMVYGTSSCSGDGDPNCPPDLATFCGGSGPPPPPPSQPELQLTCTEATVERGQNVGCVVSATQGAGFTVLDWEFHPADPAIDTIGRTSNISSHSWSGPIVTSGKVLVRASVGSLGEKTATRTISVTPRTSFPTTVNLVVRRLVHVPSRLQYEPTHMSHFGLADHEYWLAPTESGTQTVVARVPDGGPNGNLVYLTGLPYIAVDYMINDPAFEPTSTFYLKHPFSRIAGNPDTCSRSDVLSQKQPILWHEGEDALPHSHAAGFKQYYQGNSQFRTESERMVSVDTVSRLMVLARLRHHQVPAVSHSNAVAHHEQNNYWKQTCHMVGVSYAQ